MALVRKTVPREWLLPGLESGRRLQELIATHESATCLAALQGFTNPRALLLQGIVEAFYSHFREDLDDKQVGLFSTVELKVVSYFQEHRCFPDEVFDGAAPGTYVLMSLMYYERMLGTDDPQQYYYVVMYFDPQCGLWRLPRERWWVEPSGDPSVPTADTRAPQTITAFVQKGSRGYPFPTLEDVLAAYLKG